MVDLKIKKYNLFLLIFIFLLNLCVKISVAQTPYQLKTVVIDAGHGGKDPGAIGKISQEKNITLAIALKTGQYIKKNIKGVKVIYTRTKDEFIPLDERANIANKNKADLFISIHVNSSKNPKAYGAETYIMGLHKTEDNLKVAIKENSAALYEKNYKQKYNGVEPLSPETYIIMNLYQNAYRDYSLRFAQLVQEQFKLRAKRKDLGVKQAGFLVLWRTTMPSVLIEVGFISNKNEEKFLNTDYGQSIIASAIYRAVKNFKKQVENKTNE